MLRSLALATAATVVVLAACGDSNSAPAAPTPLAGTVAGQPFTPADGSAVVLAQATCTVGGQTGNGTGLAVAFSTVAGLCDFAKANGVCTTQASSTTVDLLVVRANLGGGTVSGPVQPGTYTIGGLPQFDAQNNYIFGQAIATKTGVCGTPSGTPVTTTATNGTIRIATIGTGAGAHVTGSADVTFADGSHVAGTFDVPVCVFDVDVCAAATCTAPTCT